MAKHDYENESSNKVHFRLFDKEATIVSDKLKLITRASKVLGLTISEFCRMAAVKEARYILMNHRREKVKIAKKILFEEELKNKKEEFENASYRYKKN